MSRSIFRIELDRLLEMIAASPETFVGELVQMIATEKRQSINFGVDGSAGGSGRRFATCQTNSKTFRDRLRDVPLQSLHISELACELFAPDHGVVGGRDQFGTY